MAVSKGIQSASLEEILNKVTEFDIAQYYLGVLYIPILINSPLRKDTKPSFSLYTIDGNKILFKDFSTGESGTIYRLLGKMWELGFPETINKINRDIPKITPSKGEILPSNPSKRVIHYSSETKLRSQSKGMERL